MKKPQKKYVVSGFRTSDDDLWHYVYDKEKSGYKPSHWVEAACKLVMQYEQNEQKDIMSNY